MLRSIAIGLVVALSAGCGGGAPMMRGLAALKEAPLCTFTEDETDAYLRWLSSQPMRTAERVVLLARQNIGQPYRRSLLGEYPFELYDSQPMYCLSASDCVTFVEQTYAMALAHDWTSFFRTLQRIRYKRGEVGIVTRNHFIEADWNVNNAWLFDDVTKELAGDRAALLRVRVDRAAFFAQRGVRLDVPTEECRDVYIPRACVPGVIDSLQDGDVVELVRGHADAQYVGHLGLLARDSDGRVMMIHSGAPAVREVPILEYIAGRPWVLGLKILRMKTQETARAEGGRGIGPWCLSVRTDARSPWGRG